MKRRSVNSFNLDTQVFSFRDLFTKHIKNFLDIDRLENIHNHIAPKNRVERLVTVENDQNSWLHKKLYEIDNYYSLEGNINTNKGDFINLYDKFVRLLAENIFNESLIYQSKPTIRVHLVKNKSVGDYHRDSDYNHPIEEFNVWVPLTESKNSATIHIQNYPSENTYLPFNCRYGEYAIFDGFLKHGNEVNEENYSRISFDFRVIKESEFKVSQKKSFTQKIKFSVGEYYNFIKI